MSPKKIEAICKIWLGIVAASFLLTRCWTWPRAATFDASDLVFESASLAVLAMGLVFAIVLKRLGAEEAFIGWNTLPIVIGVVMVGSLTDLLDEFIVVPHVIGIVGELFSTLLGGACMIFLATNWYAQHPEPANGRWHVKIPLGFGVAYLAIIALSILFADSYVLRHPIRVEWALKELIAIGLSLGFLIAMWRTVGPAKGYIPAQLALGAISLLPYVFVTNIFSAVFEQYPRIVYLFGKQGPPTAFYAMFYVAFLEAFRRAACPRVLTAPKPTEAVCLMEVSPESMTWPSVTHAIWRVAKAGHLPIILLTRPGSPLHTLAKEALHPEKTILMRPGASLVRQDDGTVTTPMDASFIEGLIREILKESKEPPLIVFDSITDAVALIGPKRAYELIRRISDRIKESGASGIFIVIPEAHDEETMALLRQMFEKRMER